MISSVISIWTHTVLHRQVKEAMSHPEMCSKDRIQSMLDKTILDVLPVHTSALAAGYYYHIVQCLIVDHQSLVISMG